MFLLAIILWFLWRKMMFAVLLLFVKLNVTINSVHAAACLRPLNVPTITELTTTLLACII